MRITVKGVQIELTDQQQKQINQELERRESETASFRTVLLRYGFRKLSTKGWVDENQIVYEQNEHSWLASIEEDGAWKYIIFHGDPIDRSYGWGRIIETPKELDKLITKALDQKRENE